MLWALECSGAWSRSGMELMVLLTAVVLLLSAVAVVEVVALMRGNDQ